MVEEQEIIREAMRLIGRRKSARKTAHLQALAEARRGTTFNAAHRARMQAAQKARREREKAEKEALALSTPPAPQKPRGRPKKSVVSQETATNPAPASKES
jgi:hypothetical protein